MTNENRRATLHASRSPFGARISGFLRRFAFTVPSVFTLWRGTLLLALICFDTAGAGENGLSISPLGYKVESVMPVGSTGAFDVVARAGVLNTGAPATNVAAQVTSATSGAVVLDGDVKFGNVPKTQPLKPVRSADTFKIRFILPTRPLNLLNALQYARSTLQGLSWRISCDTCVDNRPPVANAGADQSTHVGAIVELDGSGSTDVDGDPLVYEWSLLEMPASSGASIEGADPAAPLARFTVDKPGRYVAQLIVRDAVSDSTSDVAVISTVNSKPEAVAGPDQTVRVGQQVQLNADGSRDADGDALNFRWALATPPTSAAVLSNTTGGSTSFMADKPGEYLIQLVANDGQEDSEPDIVIVSTENSAPIALAGPTELSGVTGQRVRFDGLGSTDPDGDALSFTWSLIGLPLESNAVIEDAATPHASFVPDRRGIYVAQLIVGDGRLDSSPSTTRIVVEAPQSPPPRISIDYPADGLHINVSGVFIAGTLDRPAAVTINGEPASFDDPLHFHHLAWLEDGLNHLAIVAEDSQGLRSVFDLRVHVDRVPPSIPVMPSVTVTVGEGGELVVSGAAGAVEAYAQVFVHHALTEQISSTRADATGAFTLIVEGEPGDPLWIRVEDPAGNSSPLVELPHPADALTFRIDSPTDLGTVEERSVIVRGVVFGPIDTAIAANGVPASITGNAGSRQFFVQVPLVTGENLISIVAKSSNGAQQERQLRVMRTGATPFSIEASAVEGAAPLDVSFELNRHAAVSIRRIDADFNGDGVTDATQASRPMPFTHQYSQPGMYRARFTINTVDERVWRYEVPIMVHASNDLDTRVRVAWAGFRQTLGAGDIEGTLGQMTPDAAQRYAPVLTRLQGSLPRIVASFSDIELVGFHGGIAEYVMAREVAGEQSAFLIYFMQMSDGVWRIASL